MAKIKKISINTMDKIVKEMSNPVEVFEWQGIEVTVTKTLSLTQMLEFVNNVAESCFTADSGKYMPEVKDFVIKSNVLEMYANFNLPSNLDHRYEIIYNTDVFEAVLNKINETQFKEMLNAIEHKLDNMAQANIEQINRQMNEIYANLDNMQEQFANIFDGIDSSDMSKLVSALAGGKFDEEKIVDMYINKKDGE